jgi:type II secretory pathway predicted ATPase ExeA
MFAQIEIRNKLKLKKAVQSRIITTSHLDSFDFPTLKEMINFRCTVAGLKNAEIFTDDAFHEIYDYSKGRPRAAIRLCHNALPYGFINQRKIIDLDILREVESKDVYA